MGQASHVHACTGHGHFAWALFPQTGAASSEGPRQPPAHADSTQLHDAQTAGGRQGHPSVVTPLRGGLDVRSRALVEVLADCDELWEFIRGFDRRTLVRGVV